MENLSDDKEREQKHSFRPIFKHICWLEAKFPAWRIDRLDSFRNRGQALWH